MIKRFLSFLLLIVSILLASCAGPAASSQQGGGSAIEQVQPTQPVSTPMEAAASPAPSTPTQEPAASPEKTGAKTTPLPECSNRSLSESILTMLWNERPHSNRLIPFDPQSELPICGYNPVKLNEFVFHAFSKDSRQMAIADFESESSSHGILHLIDLLNWEAITTTVPVEGYVSQMAFSPDGTRLVIASSDNYQTKIVLRLVDLEKQQVTARGTIHVTPRFLEFTPDGASVIAFGGFDGMTGSAHPPAHMAMLDATDLSIQWDQPLPEIKIGVTQPQSSDSETLPEQWEPGIAFSPDEMILYIVHADEDRLTSINFKERSVKTVEIHPKLSWPERLIYLTAEVAQAKALNGTVKQAILSRDGKQLFVLGFTHQTEKDANGEFKFSETPLGLKVIDLSTGTELAKLDTLAFSAVLSPDGKVLYLQGWTSTDAWTDVVPTDSLEVAYHLSRLSVVPTRLLGGKPVLLATRQSNDANLRMALLHPDSLDQPFTWPANGRVIRGYPILLDP